MKKSYMPALFVLFLAFLYPLCASGARNDSILQALENVLERRNTFYVMREYRIDSLRNIERGIPAGRYMEKADALHNIFSEFGSYQADSALSYSMRELEQARLTGNYDAVTRAKTDLLFTYMSNGGFTDAVDIVNTIDLSKASPAQKAQFYFLCIRLFSDLSVYSGPSFSGKYSTLSGAYCDSVMNLTSPGSYFYQYASVFNQKNPLSLPDKIKVFRSMLARSDVDAGSKAMVASILADFYRQAGDKDNELYFKAKSAILDVQAAKRETLSKLDLAQIMFSQGDINRAYRYCDLAYEDANYYNSRNRMIQIMNVLPLIEKARYLTADNERTRLRWITGIVIFLLVLLGASVVFIIKQMKKLKASRRLIEERNVAIEKSNEELSRTLDKYHESVRIKDEYIGYSFYLNAAFIKKIESLYNLVDRKLKARQYDDLYMSLKQSELRKEKEQMIAEFDRTFLRLFPAFIERYKALFAADDPKNAECDGKSLTTEMRIFALIRLGINDIGNIALFLNYSVNTINTYKTKAKNRSRLPNDKFEDAIMQIKSV